MMAQAPLSVEILQKRFGILKPNVVSAFISAVIRVSSIEIGWKKQIHDYALIS